MTLCIDGCASTLLHTIMIFFIIVQLVISQLLILLTTKKIFLTLFSFHKISHKNIHKIKNMCLLKKAKHHVQDLLNVYNLNGIKTLSFVKHTHAK